MSNVQGLKQAVADKEQEKKTDESEAGKIPFYKDPLFWIRISIGAILLMWAAFYFLFSE
jgi:hypothetical protein